MKQIIIFLLLCIVGLIVYGQYQKYKRFSLSEYAYQIPETIDISNADRSLLLDYYEAVEAVNGYVITQWSSEEIDVRNPQSDDDEEMAAVSEYRKKLANVKFYEARLLNPSEKEKPKSELSEADEKKLLISKMFNQNPSANSLRLGESSALIFEVQRLLNEKGDSLIHDGLFRTGTFNALKAFEEKNGLFPDGRLDALTLEYLLK